MSRPNVLVVTRDPSIPGSLRGWLPGLGYAGLHLCEDGAAVLRRAAKDRPSAVIVDLAAGGHLHARDLARTVRERFRVPVVFLAESGEEPVDAETAAEAFGFLTRPLSRALVEAVLRMALHRHETEVQLREAREEQATILATAGDGFLLADLTGRVLDGNEAYCRMSGYTRDELIGLHLEDLTVMARPGEIAARIASIQKDGSARFERRHRCRDGSIRDVEISVHYLPHAGGRLFNFVRDITDRKRAEDALRASEQRFRNVLQDLSTVAVQGFGADGTILYWNRGCEVLYGYSAGEAIGRNLLDLIIPADQRAEVHQAVEQSVRTGVPIAAAELSLLRKDGSRVTVFSSHTVVQSPGSAPELFCIDVDLGELRRAESALRESELKFSQAFHHSPVMMALSSHDDGVFVDVNEAFLRFSGYRRSEVLGRRSIDLGWVEAALRSRLVAALDRSGSIREVEIPARTKHGALLQVLYSAESVQVAGQRLVLSTWRDVTEQRRVEALSRLQTSALEAAANAIVIMDRQGVIEWANPAFTRLSGFTPEEYSGRPLGQLLDSGHQEPEFFEQLKQTIAAGKVWNGEITNRRKDDSICIVDTTITPVMSERGEITHFVAVKQDITQRKVLEDQFRQAQKMEAVGQLAGGVAHDFNNILAAVLMYLGILHDEPSTDPRLRGMLNELQKEVKRGASLTRQLLTFSRQQAIEPQPLDLNQVISGLMKMLGRLLGEHIAITVEAASDPLPFIEADLGMMEQVMINLCVNARDAMEHGGRLTLRTSVVELTPRSRLPHPKARVGRFVRMDVTDTGCGMDEKTRRRLFEPFFTTKPAGRGTGLGLATVYGIVQQHQGWIDVQTAPNQGTTFSVFLPAATHPLPARTEAEFTQPARGHGEAILVVEDDPSVRTLIVRSLQLGGYQVYEADSGPNALSLWREHSSTIHLLLTDMVMPDGMDGRALAARLHGEKPELRVVLCTGYCQIVAPDDKAERLTLLRKPFDAPELLRTIRAALDAS